MVVEEVAGAEASVTGGIKTAQLFTFLSYYRTLGLTGCYHRLMYVPRLRLLHLKCQITDFIYSG